MQDIFPFSNIIFNKKLLNLIKGIVIRIDIKSFSDGDRNEIRGKVGDKDNVLKPLSRGFKAVRIRGKKRLTRDLRWKPSRKVIRINSRKQFSKIPNRHFIPDEHSFINVIEVHCAVERITISIPRMYSKFVKNVTFIFFSTGILLAGVQAL